MGVGASSLFNQGTPAVDGIEWQLQYAEYEELEHDEQTVINASQLFAVTIPNNRGFTQNVGRMINA